MRYFPSISVQNVQYRIVSAACITAPTTRYPLFFQTARPIQNIRRRALSPYTIPWREWLSESHTVAMITASVFIDFSWLRQSVVCVWHYTMFSLITTRWQDTLGYDRAWFVRDAKVCIILFVWPLCLGGLSHEFYSDRRHIWRFHHSVYQVHKLL